MNLPAFLQEVEADLKKKGLAVKHYPWLLVPGTKDLYVARFFEWEPIYIEARVTSRDYMIFSANKKCHIPVAI